MFLKDSDFIKLRDYIYDLTGIYLRDTKNILLSNRIRKRLRELHLETFESYIEYLFNNRTKELQNFIDVVTTNETYFFREEKHWDFFKDVIIKNKIANNDKSLKIWSAASSTGEEPYTAVIVCFENIPDIENWHIELWATDINETVLEKAAGGIYNTDRLRLVSEEMRKKYFNEERIDELKYVLKDEIKNKVKFLKHNLLNSFLYKEFDLIICRNVLIYFDNKSRDKVINNLIMSLKKNGYLFLGHSEGIIEKNYNLEFIKPSIFRRIK